LGLAETAEGDTRVCIDDWALTHRGDAYETKIAADGFSLVLKLQETQPIMLNGDAGLSRKGPEAGAASYYYSAPHLKVSGTIARDGRNEQVSGEAWLDHEWSSEYLDAQAGGWDWIGINFDDGGALMAFRIRDLEGRQRWAGGTLRGPDGTARVLGPGDIEFRPGRQWTSPRTGTAYPVQWQVRAADRIFALQPMMDDQENDARLSTGAIYWEGAVRASEDGVDVGGGHLELTGYGERLRLR
jgi:predicted secreted hydrolase